TFDLACPWRMQQAKTRDRELLNQSLLESLESFSDFFGTSVRRSRRRRGDMDKMNKYKQSNHNARGANRRGRWAKLSFKARAGQWARTVPPLPTRRTAQILTI